MNARWLPVVMASAAGFGVPGGMGATLSETVDQAFAILERGLNEPAAPPG